MSSTYTVTAQSSGTLKLHVNPLIELEEQGYTVVKGVIPRDKARQYVSSMYHWLESFGKGFKADDKNTWHLENLPNFNRGGIFFRYGVCHEQFAWDMRSEPAIIDLFAKIWGTEELLVSFDSINMSLPLPELAAAGRTAPWPHVDQSPHRRFKHCVQGLVNLMDNGDKDGGLMVLEGSMPLYKQYFEEHEHLAPEGGWSWQDSYHFKDEQMQWFYDRGCRWKKVNVDPGDVILWDSRCIHYGAAAQGDRSRLAIYVCYKPASMETPEKAIERRLALDQFDGTTHDPIFFARTGSNVEGLLDPDERTAPLVKPVLTYRAQQLAGLEAY